MKCSVPNCKAQALIDDECCYFHSQNPEVQAKVQQGRINGGKRIKSKGKFEAPKTLEDAQRMLAWVMTQYANKKMSRIEASSLTRMIALFQKGCELTELNDKLTRIEEERSHECH